MPSQFEIVNRKLDQIIDLLTEREDELFGEDPYTENPEEYAPKKPYRSSETRTHVEVRNLDGDIEMVPWSEIDERIIEAIRLTNEIRRDNPDNPPQGYQLYRDPNGMIRITVDQAVLAQMHKNETYQQPVPREGTGPDALGAAKPKE